MSNPIAILEKRIERAQREVEMCEDSLRDAEDILEALEDELRKLLSGADSEELEECQSWAKRLLDLPGLGAGYVYDLCWRVMDGLADEKNLAELRRRQDFMEMETELRGAR